jgi:sugar phosphate isomerase/epimerase
VLDRAGRDNIQILLDVWHSWPEPDLLTNLKSCVGRLIGVPINDVRNRERSWCDRVMPGDGCNVCTPIVAALIQAGFTGWYDFEVFSDDGRWGNDFADSLWKLPHGEFVARGHDAFARVYENGKKMVASGNVPQSVEQRTA